MEQFPASKVNVPKPDAKVSLATCDARMMENFQRLKQKNNTSFKSVVYGQIVPSKAKELYLKYK
jgi:hypothetical protein